MPKDNIQRAIKNAMGKDTSDYKEVTYEGYGPHGVAIFVDTLTDNTTRTVGDVRSIFNKFNGNLGTQGSLSFLFDQKAVFTFKKKDGLDMEELILDLIDYGVEDEFDEDEEENEITIYGEPTSFGEIQKHLEDNGFEITSAEFTRIPNDLKDVTAEERETIDKMVERLEDFDDVQNVYREIKLIFPNKVLLAATQIMCFYIFDIVSFCFLFVGAFTFIIILSKDNKNRFCPNFSHLYF